MVQAGHRGGHLEEVVRKKARYFYEGDHEYVRRLKVSRVSVRGEIEGIYQEILLLNIREVLRNWAKHIARVLNLQCQILP
jgi:hypothetical protein